MAKLVEGEGIRFEGRVYKNWPDLSRAISRAGQLTPAQWIAKNEKKVKKAFSIGLNENNVPVIVTDDGTPRGEAVATAAEDKVLLTDSNKMVEDLIRSYFPDYDFEAPANQAFIQRIKDRVAGKSEPDLIVNELFADDGIDLLFPGFSSLADAGVISASGVDAGRDYINWRNSVNEAFELHFGRSMDAAELGQVANGAVTGGYTAAFLLDYYGFIDTVGDAFERHNGRIATTAELNKLFQTGKSADTIESEFKGIDFINANRGDIQSQAGAFNFGGGGAGAGQFSSTELTALGNQQFGLETELGFDIQRRVALATQRMGRIFQGQAAQGTLNLPGGATRGAPGSRVDVGA